MKKSRLDREYSLRFLVIRAVVTIALVLAVLLGLKLGGITVTERDLPVQEIEEAAEEAAMKLPAGQS